MNQNTVTTVAHAIDIALALTSNANTLLVLAGQVGALVAKAQAEGRELTQEDWAQLDAADQAAKAALDDAITQRLATTD